jgi:hypothetical protein
MKEDEMARMARSRKLDCGCRRGNRLLANKSAGLLAAPRSTKIISINNSSRIYSSRTYCNINSINVIRQQFLKDPIELSTMDDVTPPKRVTRSKATAKTKTAEPEVKIVTAAGRAKATRNVIPAAAKRKTRTEDLAEDTNDKAAINNEPMDEDTIKPKATRGRKKAIHTEPEVEKIADEEVSVSAPPTIKSTRGRPKKIVEEAPPVEAPKATRGRARKVEVLEEPLVEETPFVEPVKPSRGRSRKAEVTEEPPMEEAQQAEPAKSTRGRQKKVEATEEPSVEEAALVEPTRSVRGRPKKIVVAEEPPAEIIPELVKKTRGRPAAISKAATVSKKSVKFEEPQEQDKENIIPDMVAKGKTKEAESGTGIKAKPVRKPAVSTRTVRGRAKTTSGDEKLPLTPKKATQVATAKDNVSEDELATMEKTPMKLLTKSPAKAPGSVFGTAKKLDFTTSIIANRAVTQDFGASLMGSPARRPPPSPYKDSLKTSPKRLNFGESMLRSPFKSSTQQPKHTTSPFKAALLQSPPKRPQSPAKVSNLGSPGRVRPTPGAAPKFNVSKFGATPRTATKSINPPRRSLLGSPSKQVSEEMPSIDSNLNATTVKPFPGRLSSILPREIDPDMHGTTASMDAAPSHSVIQEEDESSIDPINRDAMIVDSEPRDVDMVIEDPQSTTPTNSPPRHSIGNFSLRNEDPFQDSDSEDELASGSPKYSPAPLNAFNISSKDFATPATPTRVLPMHKTPKTAVVYRSGTEDEHNAARSHSVKARKDKREFLPLSRQLSDWMSAAAESSSSSDEERQGLNKDIETIIQPSPAKSTFFEDAMTSEKLVEGSTPDEVLGSLPLDPNDGMDALTFAPTTLDEEDLALAAEADEMSLIAVDAADAAESADILNQSIRGDTRAVSEASQEYGDENAAPAGSNEIPIDPALLAFDAQHQTTKSVPIDLPAVFTPVRVLRERQRVFHTVSKVPLKPAAADSPLKVDKRCATASRMQAQRQAPLPPSFAVPKLPSFEQGAILTPVRSNSWSTAGTPIRIPRRDLNDQVLKGAVVFVDVHTTEGADASAVFVELLGQMGARCVKAWSWNPNSVTSPEAGSADQAANGVGSKIGITHVVFKDGGKRTLEKVRESKGVVLCVGVGWVLE